MSTFFEDVQIGISVSAVNAELLCTYEYISSHIVTIATEISRIDILAKWHPWEVCNGLRTRSLICLMIA